MSRGKEQGRRNSRPDATGRDSKRLGSDGAVIILRRSFWLSPQVVPHSRRSRRDMHWQGER